MARLARVVIPDIPHHVIQRGNRRQKVFFNDNDREKYLKLLSHYAVEAGLSFIAYCLMDNHVHLIVIPKNGESLARGIGEVHKKYTRMINAREEWTGYLWQGRFVSYPMDEQYLYYAIKYVELNPVRAGLVKKAENYPWSSAKAHVFQKKDVLLSDDSMLPKVKDWSLYLGEKVERRYVDCFRENAFTGRPLGNDVFISKLERLTGKILKKKKPGPQKK